MKCGISATKENEIKTFSRKYTDLENYYVWDATQSQKDKYLMLSLIGRW